MITVAALQERLAKLHRDREVLVANLNAFNGAIEECEYWLHQLDDEAADSESAVSLPVKEA